MTRVEALGFHLPYGCKSSGVCCSSGWPIAVEDDVKVRLEDLLPRVRDRLPRDEFGFVSMDQPPRGCSSALRVDSKGAVRACWFLDGTRTCAVHRNFGEPALPSACRHFPRVTVLDPTRVAISLSHYCPSAVALLFDREAAWGIRDAVTAFPKKASTTAPAGGDIGLGYEGLDARRGDPPLLRPDVFLGFDGLAVFERRAVESFERAPSVETALVRIGLAIETIRGWRYGLGTVPDYIDAVFEAISSTAGDSREIDLGSDHITVLAEAIKGSDPPGALPRSSPPRRRFSEDLDRALRRFLSARLFGAWISYQGQGLRSVFRYLTLCHELVRTFEAEQTHSHPADRLKEAMRLSDLWLVHYSDPQVLADALGMSERRSLLRTVA